MHAEYEHELLFRAKRSCDDAYRVAVIAPFFKSHPDTMHLRCISKCAITANCTYAFAQNERDGIKSGKCQLFTRCDKYRSETRRGRLYILRPKTTTTSTTTTTTTTTTTNTTSTTTRPKENAEADDAPPGNRTRTLHPVSVVSPHG